MTIAINVYGVVLQQRFFVLSPGYWFVTLLLLIMVCVVDLGLTANIARKLAVHHFKAVLVVLEFHIEFLHNFLHQGLTPTISLAQVALR